MWRRFLRLELATQLFILAGLLSLLLALCFGLGKVELAHAIALDRARTAANLAAAFVAIPTQELGSAGSASRPLTRLLLDAPRGARDGAAQDPIEVKLLAPSNEDESLDRFELAATSHLRTSGEDEYHEVGGDRLMYASALIKGAACAARCGAPEGVDATGRPTNWGRPASVRLPMLIVSVPLLNPDGPMPRALSGPALMTGVAALVAGLVLFAVWLRQLTRSAQILEGFADRVVNAAPGEPVARVMLDEDEHDSSNELHRLSQRMRALSRALYQLQCEKVPPR